MFSNCYAKRRVFVTGHTGFKGFWLSAWLLELGADVAGYALEAPTEPSGFAALGLRERIRHYSGDICDGKALASAMRKHKPEIVIHMAAQALVRASYDQPEYTFATNAMGTLQVLEAARATPSVHALVLVTSDKCYRNNEWIYGYRETDHLGGDDPYSASKACAELIAHAYSRSFFQNGPRIARARAGNVIGGGDWAADRIVPDCARAWSSRSPAVIRNPLATRPWQHVLEPLSGYLWLGARLFHEATAEDGAEPLHGEAFNFGPAADMNAGVHSLTKEFCALWPGFRPAYARDSGTKKKESTLLKLCCDKALDRLDWRAALGFADSVRFTADWYRAFYERKSPDAAAMYAFTAEQIAEYTAAARNRDIAWTR